MDIETYLHGVVLTYVSASLPVHPLLSLTRPAFTSPRPHSPSPVTEKLLSRDPLTDLRRAFALFDDDHTGKISLKNLKRVARELGENLGEEEL